MPVPTFIICSTPDSPETEQKVLEAFGNDDSAYVIRENSQWLVAAEMTTQQVHEKIELESKVKVVVFLTTNYFGHHNKDMWEWLALE